MRSDSLIRIFTGHISIAKNAKFLHGNNKDLSDCAGSLESLLGVHIRRYVFSRCGSFICLSYLQVSRFFFQPKYVDIFLISPKKKTHFVGTH